MALTFGDNIHTKTFTPQEYLVELLSSAKSKNVVISLEGVTNKVFLILKLVQELTYTINRLVYNIFKLTNCSTIIVFYIINLFSFYLEKTIKNGHYWYWTNQKLSDTCFVLNI